MNNCPITFKVQIEQKKINLIEKANELPNIKIDWQEPITIKCTELTTFENVQNTEFYNVIYNNNKSAAIYYFKIVSTHSPSAIFDLIKEHKKNPNTNCPKIDKHRDLQSKYLYCGSVKKDIHTRFKQHIGFGSEKTYTLKLLDWATATNLELRFYYGLIKPEYKEYTELLESCLAEKIKPLVGKIEKF